MQHTDKDRTRLDEILRELRAVSAERSLVEKICEYLCQVVGLKQLFSLWFWLPPSGTFGQNTTVTAKLLKRAEPLLKAGALCHGLPASSVPVFRGSHSLGVGVGWIAHQNLKQVLSAANSRGEGLRRGCVGSEAREGPSSGAMQVAKQAKWIFEALQACFLQSRNTRASHLTGIPHHGPAAIWTLGGSRVHC